MTRLLTLIAVFCLGLSAKAADIKPCDLGEITLGQTYNVPAWSKPITAHFTAPSAGEFKAVVYNLQLTPAVGTTPDAASMTQMEFETYDNNSQVYTLDIEAGTHYVSFGTTLANFSDGTVTFYLSGVTEDATHLIDVTPAMNLPINFANYENTTITFSDPVTMTGAKLVYTDSENNQKEVSVTPSVNDVTVVVPVYTAIKPLLESGSINPGDDLSIVLVGLKDASGKAVEGSDADGNFAINFKCGSIPALEVSRKVPTTFKSYWAPGDESAILSITYDRPLSIGAGTALTLGYGNRESENNEYYVESIVPTLSEDAKTIIVDLAGKQRTRAIMLPTSTTDYSIMEVALVGVVDAYGNPVKSAGYATIGSYSWNIPYVETPKVNIASEFDPANGASLDGVENIEVYLTPLNQFTFTGFNLAYDADNGQRANVFVAKDQATMKDESSDGSAATFTFAVPAEVKGKKNVVVTLADLKTEDGYDHSQDVMAKYDGFVITWSDPENGTKMETLPANTVISIETNYAATHPEMYVMYEIADMTNDGEIIKTQVWMNRQADGKYTASLHNSYKLILNHEYRILVTAWENEMAKNYKEAPIGTDYVTLYGLTPPYVYSSIELESISPERDSTISPENNVITLTFTGMVRLNSETTFINTGFGSSANFQSIEGVEPDENGYSNIWKLTIAPSFIESATGMIDISMAATDMDGRRVKGDLGEEDQTYFYWSYEVAGMYKPVTVEVVGTEPYESVSQIKVSYADDAINYSYAVPLEEAIVTSKLQETVAHVVDAKAEEVELGQKPHYVILTLDKPITTEGSYMLFIPKNYFAIGEEFDTYRSEAVEFEFTVGGSAPEVAVDITPAVGTVTELPKTIEMVFTTYSEIALGSGKPSFKINDAAPVDLNDADLDYDIWNKCTVTLPQAYTEEGTYTLSFPEGYFTLGASGDASPALSFTWTIEAEGPSVNVTASPADASTVDELYRIELTFNDASEVAAGSGRAILSINGGEAINLPDPEIDFDLGWNQIVQNMDQKYTADGTYEISFPEGYFNLGASGDACPAFKLTYYIGVGGVDAIGSADGLMRVYNLSGVLLLETEDTAAVKNLPAGIYIVNGKKLILK